MKHFFLFELGSVDVILEVDWLAKLGEVKLNWKTITMSFMRQGHDYPALSKNLVSSRELKKEIEIIVVCMCWRPEIGY